MTQIRLLGVAVVLAALGIAAFAAATPAWSSGDDSSHRIAIRDDCDPSDPSWNAVGGCALPRGDVTFAEFNAELSSPLSTAVVGHQAWRNDPSYLKVRAGATIQVRNAGGRQHTFTEVANFGGGKVPNPALNKGLITAPECPGSKDIPPGGSATVMGLSVGNHRFQCCIHPWMRALINVKPVAAEDDE
jgi:plastocyanin